MHSRVQSMRRPYGGGHMVKVSRRREHTESDKAAGRRPKRECVRPWCALTRRHTHSAPPLRAHINHVRRQTARRRGGISDDPPSGGLIAGEEDLCLMGTRSTGGCIGGVWLRNGSHTHTRTAIAAISAPPSRRRRHRHGCLRSHRRQECIAFFFSIVFTFFSGNGDTTSRAREATLVSAHCSPSRYRPPTEDRRSIGGICAVIAATYVVGEL